MREGIFELRTLTAEEEKDVKHIVYATHTSWQIMFGLIAEDMLSVKEKQLKVSYKELVEKGHTIKDSADGFTILWGTFEAWISENMNYKNMGHVKDLPEETKGLRENIDGVIKVLTYYLCDIGDEMSTETEQMLGRTFEYYDQELMDSEGVSLQEHPQMLMRFIVTALEVFGFTRSKKDGENQYIDTSAIAYEDFW